MKKQLALLLLLLISNLSFADTNTSAVSGSESSVNANTTSSSQGGSVGNTAATGGVSNSNATGGNASSGATNSNASTGASSAHSGATNSNSKSVGNASGNVNIDNHGVTNAPAVDLSKAVGMAVAPSLTTTFSETCMGSTSAGAGFAGGAISIGSTWEDEACIRRLDAREVKSMGDAETAKEIMCGSKEVREAFKRVGRPCAIDGGTYAATPKPITINDLSKQKQQELYQAAVIRQTSTPKL